MATYFVDDGGSATDPYDTWAKAATSIQQLDTAKTLASGDIIYIGADSNCTNAAAALTITGPANSPPVMIISSTVGSGSTVSYSAGTGDQIIATGGSYAITFDGAFALYGIRVKAGANIVLGADGNESFYTKSCEFIPGANGQVTLGAANAPEIYMNDDTINLTNDSAGATAAPINVATACNAFINGLTLTNASNRTGVAVAGNNSYATVRFNSCDFSGLVSSVEFLDGTATRGNFHINNCKATSGAGWFQGSLVQYTQTVTVTNSGTADDPAYMSVNHFSGTVTGTSSIYRTGGASFEGTPVGWLITTSTYCSEGSPLYTPWIYGTVSSTGSKTFDVYITHDANTTFAADFTDAEVWLEVEYFGTADEANWTLASDQRATITTTAAAQTDDTTSTWNGTGPSFTYKQKLSVTATVNETGQYRARVAVGATSVNSGHYFYIDPKVTVS